MSMQIHTNLDIVVSRAEEVRMAVAEESARMEKNLVEYRRRVGLTSPDDDDAEFKAQAAYRARRETRTKHD